MYNFATKKRCPRCGYARSWGLRREKRKCKKCRREFSVRSCLVPGIRSTDQEWKRCIRVFLRERTLHAVMRETGTPYVRAQHMLHHLRTCMLADVPKVFPGPVELDETYIGGQRKNKRLHIRKIQGKRGHGTDKLPIVGVFDRTSGRVHVAVEPRKLDLYFILDLLRQRVVSRAHVYTDGFKMYRMFPGYGYRHAYVDHDGGEMVRGDVHTNNIEGFWGILKRKLSCIGGARRKKLPLFVGEIVWRFNHRSLPIATQESLLLELVTKSKFGGRS